ncbi:host attachment protein [Roseomonas eburnea]|uniref:Host attachment protein n=1 Tax=Neoroseomonas eburnea TaxID=1346889 RepID=A0A9X9XHY1_9PROT|nr:host attachment protein [Neoroseomonas eburnea]MBR0683317.1 host attachment protein [Neoroseomonas eburnea]
MSTSANTIEGGRARRLFVVANGSHGRAYLKRLGETGYDAVIAWASPDARAKDSELGEDKPGRAFAGAGATARSAMEYDNKDDSPKEHAKRDLARQMAADIVAALKAGKADSFSLVAPATVAAAIRSHVPHEVQRALVGEEHHDLTSLPVAEVFARLDALRHGV